MAAAIGWNLVVDRLAAWQWVVDICCGLVLWKLLEYLLHRFVFHIVPTSRWLLEKQQHLQHHRAPEESDFYVVPLWFSLPITLAVQLLLRLALGSWEHATLVATGTIGGYLTYELVHFGIHMGRGHGRLMRYWRAHHFYHHYTDSRRCWGFTSPLWDIVFRTGRAREPRPPGLSARTLRYVNAMFPPRAMLPIGAAHFLSIYLALQALVGGAPLRIGWRAAAGAATTVLWMLLVRLQDDIADADADVRLGRAGDPRYRDRPIVKGEITVGELRAISLSCLILLLGINGWFGPSAMLAACVAGLVITWLGFRWFFIPALARDPSPIAYLVRKALTVLLGVYAVAVFLDDFPRARLGPWTALLLIAPVAEVAAWETARKIRIPDDETEYGTYSKVLGWRTASLLPIAFIAVALACLLLVARRIGLGWLFVAALTAAAILAIAAALRFRLAPTRARANLRPYAELFGAVAHAGLVVALDLRYGLALA